MTRSPRTPLSLLVLLSLLTALPACHHPTQSSVLRTQSFLTWTRTDLYFGLTRRDSSLITDAAFQAFVDQTITPQFPAGFTLTPAAGQYLDSKNLLHKEPSRILTLLYSKSDASAADEKIRHITTLYCQKFDQECVLRTDAPAKTEFLSAKHNP